MQLVRSVQNDLILNRTSVHPQVSSHTEPYLLAIL